MKILVIGAGYVGLTTSVTLAYLGNKVTCLDVNEEKIKALQAGKQIFFEPGISELIALAKTNLTFSSSYDEVDIDSSDVVFIAVGTPPLPDNNADLSYVKSAVEKVGERLDGSFTRSFDSGYFWLGWVSRKN